jgi:hypothetical protein
LGEFDFHNGRLRLTSYHPGVEIKRIQAKTGFELEIAPEIHETVLPTNEEIRLLYEEIDPLGIRRLEGMSGASRRQLLREIISIEARELNESSSKFVAE